MEENKAIVQIEPQKDLEVVNLYNEAIKLQEYANARVITTEDDLKPATDDLSIISKLKKALEEKRRDYVKPLQEHVKTINEAFKTLMQPIEEADRVTRGKILTFQTEQARRRQEQEKINQIRMEAAQREAALNGGEIAESVDLVEVSPEVSKRVSTDMGTVGQRMVRKWELENFELVPDAYKILDSAKITKVVKAGIPSIPGISIYEEPTLTVNAR